MTERIVVKKMFGRWLGSCPECPPSKGFVDSAVWQLIQMWSVSHADMHRQGLHDVERRGKR